jgi:hypothetical protein
MSEYRAVDPPMTTSPTLAILGGNGTGGGSIRRGLPLSLRLCCHTHHDQIVGEAIYIRSSTRIDELSTHTLI